MRVDFIVDGSAAAVDADPAMPLLYALRDHPILEMADAPESIEVVLIDRPEMNPSGAGEPSTRPVPAAVANAIFDATGARLRRVPITPGRVKAALASA